MTDGYYIDVKEIGKNIRKRRLEKDMTLDQLADLTQLGGKSLLSKYENGQTPRLTVDALLRIADALDCEPDYLVGRIPYPNRITSEVSEQIPLSREAIEKLVSAKAIEKSELFNMVSDTLDLLNTFIVTLVPDVGSDGEVTLYEKSAVISNILYKLKTSIEAEKKLGVFSVTDFHKLYDEDYEGAMSYTREHSNISLAIDGNKHRLSLLLSDIIDEHLKSITTEV